MNNGGVLAAEGFRNPLMPRGRRERARERERGETGWDGAARLSGGWGLPILLAPEQGKERERESESESESESERERGCKIPLYNQTVMSNL